MAGSAYFQEATKKDVMSAKRIVIPKILIS
jgi:hypothetical protein